VEADYAGNPGACETCRSREGVEEGVSDVNLEKWVRLRIGMVCGA
jgi:hypothetical protein